MKKETPKYQSIIITLNDGRKGVFVGPVLVTEEDEKKGLLVVKQEFTIPRPLPAGVVFGPIEESENGQRT